MASVPNPPSEQPDSTGSVPDAPAGETTPASAASGSEPPEPWDEPGPDPADIEWWSAEQQRASERSERARLGVISRELANWISRTRSDAGLD
jgi:hypothetical protein